MRLTRYVSPTGAALGAEGEAWGVVVASLRELHPKSAKTMTVAIEKSFRFMQLLFPKLQLYCLWETAVEAARHFSNCAGGKYPAAP